MNAALCNTGMTSLGECEFARERMVAGTDTPIPSCPLHGSVQDDLCECGHPGYDGHDMRSVPPACLTPGCSCGHVCEGYATGAGWADCDLPMPHLHGMAADYEAEHNEGAHDGSEPSYAGRCPVCFAAVADAAHGVAS